MKSLFRILVLLATLAFVLSASEKKVEKISLQLSWKHQFQFAGYYMAKEKGYYADANLDVELIEHNNVNVVDEVLNKKTTYGVGHSSIITDIANGKKLKMLFPAFQSSPSVLIALKEAHVSTIEEFRDKRIMVTEDMSSEVSLQAILKKNKLNISDMEVQKHSYNIESLLQGETDIMASYISNEPYVLKKQEKEFVIFDPADEGFDFYSDILFTTNDEIFIHPQRAKAFAEASLKGWEYAFSHIDESVAVVLAKYNTQNRTKEALLYEAHALKKLAYASDAKLGELQKIKLQRIYDIYNVLGFIKNNIEIDKVYHTFNKKLLTPQEETYLKEKKYITYCIDPDWMPYEKIQNEEHIGMSANFVKLFEDRLKIPMQLLPTESWAQSLEYMKEKKCDLLPLASKTPSREKDFIFTQPYIDVTVVMATRLGIPFIDDFEAIQHKQIGITKGFALIEIFKQMYPNFEIVEVKNAQDGLSRVVDGEIFGYVGSLADIAYLFQNRFVGELKISGKFDKSWSHGVALQKEDAQLFEIFDKVVKNITPQEKQEIENRWIPIHYDEAKDFTFLWWILGFLALGFAVALVLFWQQKKINKVVQMQAAHDYMTQLYNRRYLTESSKHLLNLAHRDGSQISIVMIDIDDFKKVNDTYGHNAGDETIKALAKVMLQEIRQSDMVARWGGEEFVMLLPQTDIEGAVVIAQKIRKATENLVMKTLANAEFRFTISLGVSKIGMQTDLNIEAAVIRADKALYEAKKSGKNRVCVNVDELLI